MLAALFEGQDPEVLIVQAVARFRCISWDTLSGMSEIIVGGGPLDVVGAGPVDLHALSTPCNVGACDGGPHSKLNPPEGSFDFLFSGGPRNSNKGMLGRRQVFAFFVFL